ncbi:NepR family anti-sigma factor [Altererythrobacter sp. H2]|uniref:NepR family anti-sigma factor n=1 Tax=Altererythrobacter sp. H2 TaxID=3108391 RepID=UPI002B4BF153|nr:NepR family anti-sigma factor [Altererythrobacter sp. H2]WRK96150.1 NepR family anti-sigma factor [Altererythrobacter sp. H2]
MATQNFSNGKPHPGMIGAGNSGRDSPPRTKAKEGPEWADGLRKLYDSVVEEPLPDSFRDLLDKLDRGA